MSMEDIKLNERKLGDMLMRPDLSPDTSQFGGYYKRNRLSCDPMMNSTQFGEKQHNFPKIFDVGYDQKVIKVPNIRVNIPSIKINESVNAVFTKRYSNLEPIKTLIPKSILQNKQRNTDFKNSARDVRKMAVKVKSSNSVIMDH